MVTRVSMRELRNHTAEVVEQARTSEVILTRHGRDVATIRALPDEWAARVDDTVAALPAPRSTGVVEELATDDASSTADLDAE